MAGHGTEVRIEPMTGAHAGPVLAIYQTGIDEGNATFETRVPRWAEFTAARLPGHRLVAIRAGQVAGWVVGTRERIGCHHGSWRDVVLVERRSPVI